MCTVSIIAPGQTRGYRVVCNRDESRERAAASGPEWRELPGAIRAIWPTDGAAGGTWIAANSAGITWCLLNLNLAPAVGPTACSPASRGLLSRGAIIPELIGYRHLADALRAVRGLDLQAYAAFRLVGIEPEREGVAGVLAHEIRWDRKDLTIRGGVGVPACFTSSGLGDERAAPRLALFEDMVARSPDERSQNAFHGHRWADRPEISVNMARSDARTVSVTSVEVAALGGGRFAVEMGYRAVADEAPLAGARVARDSVAGS